MYPENVTQTLTTPIQVHSKPTKQIFSSHLKPLVMLNEINCKRFYNIDCVKLKIIILVDELSSFGGHEILPGVSIVHYKDSKILPESSNITDDLIHNFPDDIDPSLVNSLLKHKIVTYLDSHELSIKYLDPRIIRSAITFFQSIWYGQSEAKEGSSDDNVSGKWCFVFAHLFFTPLAPSLGWAEENLDSHCHSERVKNFNCTYQILSIASAHKVHLLYKALLS
ncbi:hypothetical protein QAD02_004357 [Eretmocerus hayati]|uniref:Uncharacterized protein n=1 Tax=Eretmocerus hayati TaxID=131215 RepID=A0ACC2NQD2_9HYME|nr:hypothetical protein QAD02_004357 [Eretmocerus hayati]